MALLPSACTAEWDRARSAARNGIQLGRDSRAPPDVFTARRPLTDDRTASSRPRTIQPLKHDFAGYWSRRITDEHRLVYKVVDREVRIAACRYRYG